jgi:tetratricopeptide (TPR) repeat protein
MTAGNPHGPFFRRHVPPDPDGLRAEIVRQRAALAGADGGAARLEALGHLGFALFMTGEAAEAAPLLDEALLLARKRGDAKTEIEVLLGLATARQYAGERARAERLFREGLALCGKTGIREQEHFLLHHLGRCHVEMGRIADAKTAFEQALTIRHGLDNKRYANFTQAALDDIAKM